MRSSLRIALTRSGKNSSRDASHHRNCVAVMQKLQLNAKNVSRGFSNFKVLRRGLGFFAFHFA